MKNNIKNTLRTGVAAVFGLVTMYACNDTWNEHYDSMSTSPTTYNGTTMQALEEEASDFAEIVKAVGFDSYLNSSSSFTVWAPANGSFNKDSVLAVLSVSKKDVLQQFVRNHVARYSIPLNLDEHQIHLLNQKLYSMTDKYQHKIGNLNILEDKSNIKCANGILHVIDGNLPFQNNIFELIESEYNKSTNPKKEEVSMYAYLKTADADSLDESRSVYRGYDEYGNKIWIDSVVFRNNTILRDLGALIYEEDSNYIAFIPSVEAYQARYDVAKEYLKYNPSMDKGLEYSRADSLQKSYANRFAMTDLFYSISMNEHIDDSLKSTQYTVGQWPEHLYYRKKPAKMPEDKKVNDIIAKVSSPTNPITCSNGLAYLFDEYPIDIYEQFLKKIKMNSRNLAGNFISSEDKIKGSNVQVTKNIGTPELWSGSWTTWIYDDQGAIIDSKIQDFSYIYIPASSTTNANVAFYIGNNFSGKYDIYVVTMPIWFYRQEIEVVDDKSVPKNKLAYNFRAWMWGKDENGNYPATGEQMKVGTQNTFTTPVPTDISVIRDTTFIGTYDFTYSYYGESEPGYLLQFATYVTVSTRSKYSYDMIYSGIILKPHNDDDDSGSSPIKAGPRDMFIEPMKCTGTLSNQYVKTLKQ